MASPPPGVWVPSPTFFKPLASGQHQPEVDVQTQVDHTVFLARRGVRGLVILGSTGEAVHLSRPERRALVAGVRAGLDRAGLPGYPIQAGVLANAVEEALEGAEDARDAGAQWALVLAPGYFGAFATQDALVQWFTAVADRSPLPILIYNYPGVTNNLMISVDTYEKLAQHPNIVGCKMSHASVSHHVQVSTSPKIDHDRFRVFSGLGQHLGPIVAFGAAGVTDGLAAIYPRAVTRLYDLASRHCRRQIDDNEYKELLSLQYRVSRAEEFIGAHSVLGIREGVYRVAGFGNLEGGRLPLRGRIPDGAWEQWAEVMGALAEV